MNHYLVVFDRAEGRLLRLDECPDRVSVMAARFQAERMHKGSRNIEVVVLGAQTEDALRKTHSRYFGDLKQLAGQGAQRITDSKASRASL